MIKRTLILCILIFNFQQYSYAQHSSDCNSPEHSTLDFWLGTWKVTWDGGEGTNTISKIVGGCAVQEQFVSDILNGMSLSSYEKSSGKWRQIWVDNQNGFIDLVGKKDGENYIFQTTPDLNKPKIQFRMVFSEIKKDSLLWAWQKTDDNGNNWQKLWEIKYSRIE